MVNYFIKILPELNLGKLLHGHLHVHRWEVDLRMGEVTMIVSTREFLECSTAREKSVVRWSYLWHNQALPMFQSQCFRHEEHQPQETDAMRRAGEKCETARVA